MWPRVQGVKWVKALHVRRLWGKPAFVVGSTDSSSLPSVTSSWPEGRKTQQISMVNHQNSWIQPLCTSTSTYVTRGNKWQPCQKPLVINDSVLTANRLWTGEALHADGTDLCGGSSGLLKVLRYENVERRARTLRLPQAGQLLSQIHSQWIGFKTICICSCVDQCTAVWCTRLYGPLVLNCTLPFCTYYYYHYDYDY